MSRNIKSVRAMEILDSHGNPTLRVHVELDNGVSAVASVPSGASPGEPVARDSGGVGQSGRVRLVGPVRAAVLTVDLRSRGRLDGWTG
ncbi:MAG: hypothetical protein HY815_19185 [Candidatus Riflebacteria bacterium]|nr:hypothetical protein [Candidatus Riflebacteria bacterium]